MIELNNRLFSEVLEIFIPGASVQHYSLITNTQKLINGRPRIRIIADVTTQTGARTIIKMVKELEHPPGLIQRQSEFSETLREKGFPVPRRYRSSGDCRYCHVLTLSGINCAVTIEDKEGERELAFINERYVRELAELMAEMHELSEKSGFLIGHGTIWDLFNSQADISRGWNRFLNLQDVFAFEGKTRELYEDIKQKQVYRRDELSQIWAVLPQYAVQGDFSTNNVMLKPDGSIQALIDFNIAGDERLVNDLVTEGIFICYIMDLEPGLPEMEARPPDEVRDGLLRLFVSTYLAKRKLSKAEAAVINPLYQCVFPFLWTTIERLEELLEGNRTDEVNKLLLEILREMERPIIQD